MELLYFGLVGLSFLVALSNWRVGVYACLVLDVLRDPIRKLSEGHSVWITVAIGLVWFGVFIGALGENRQYLQHALRQYWRMRKAFQLVVLALLPGAILSVLLYPGGYKLAIIGSVSYLAPFLGIAIGFSFAKSERQVIRLLQFYSVLNSVALIGTVLEYSGSDLAILGGIDMVWIRYHGTMQVQMISGIYRSPDIMGLHAAHVTMFAATIGMHSKGLGKLTWGGLAAWGALCLLLGGRRKMIAMPLVFVATYLLVGMWRGSQFLKKAKAFLGVGLLAGVTVLFSVREVEVSQEYTDYASTLISQGASRGQQIVVGSLTSTLAQTGIIGAGLGSATQGNHYAGVSGYRSWQEDGASRLLKELGLPGVLLVMIALLLVLRSLVQALQLLPVTSMAQQLQIALLAVVAANAASFIASHQQYSGDPSTSLFVLLILGAVFAMPNAHAGSARCEQARAARPGEAIGQSRRLAGI